MSERNTVIRALNDVGLAAWFGGSLMGVVGLNGAAEQEGGNFPDGPAGQQRLGTLDSGQRRGHRPAPGRSRRHRGGESKEDVRPAWRRCGERGEDGRHRAALVATAYARVLGKKIELASSPNQEDARRAEDVPVDVEQAQKQLSVVQWSIPVLTGVLEVLNALHGEQQRPREQVRGAVRKVMSLPGQLRTAA